MLDMEAPFEIEYEGSSAKVTEHELEDMRVFHILFTGKRKPLVITIAEAAGGKKMVDVGTARAAKRSRRSRQAYCCLYTG